MTRNGGKNDPELAENDENGVYHSPKTFTDGIRRRIRHRTYSYRQVGEETGVDHSLLSGFVRGIRPISTDTLDKLVAWLETEDAREKEKEKR